MTLQEYEDYKQKELELAQQRNKILLYEELMDNYNALTSSIDRLAASETVKSVETNGPFTYLQVTDHNYCRNLMIRLFEHERNIVKQKIEML